MLITDFSVGENIGVSHSGHPFTVLGPVASVKVLDRRTGLGTVSHLLEIVNMVTKQQNQWNWSATTYVYTHGCKAYLTAFDTEQVWDGTRAGHDRLMGLLVERLEDQRDRMGLAFRVYQPTVVRGRSWASSLPEVIEID